MAVSTRRPVHRRERTFERPGLIGDSELEEGSAPNDCPGTLRVAEPLTGWRGLTGAEIAACAVALEIRARRA